MTLTESGFYQRNSICIHHIHLDLRKELLLFLKSKKNLDFWDVCVWLILSPGDEAGGHGGPGDAAGVGLLALVLLVLAAAAQAAQVDGQTQQVEAEAGRRHAAQEYEGLRREGRKRRAGMKEEETEESGMQNPCGAHVLPPARGAILTVIYY